MRRSERGNKAGVFEVMQKEDSFVLVGIFTINNLTKYFLLLGRRERPVGLE